MKKPHYVLLLLLLIFSCNKEKGIYVGGYYWTYGYGLPNRERLEAIEGISGKWKIKHHSLGFCMVDPETERIINRKNKATYAALTEKYGKDWLIRYNRDIESFMMKKIDVMDVLITNRLFRNELNKYYIKIDDIDKEIKELNDSLYEVVVYNHKLKAENKVCFTVNVNIKERTVNLIK